MKEKEKGFEKWYGSFLSLAFLWFNVVFYIGVSPEPASDPLAMSSLNHGLYLVSFNQKYLINILLGFNFFELLIYKTFADTTNYYVNFFIKIKYFYYIIVSS